MKLTEQQVEKSLKWWLDVLSNPKFDNGEKRGPSVMASMLASMNTEPLTGEQKDAFSSVFREHMSKENPFYLEKEDRHLPKNLSVDYGPNVLLSMLMQKAGISESNAPWKTTVSFQDDGTVRVSYGYSAPWVEL